MTGVVVLSVVLNVVLVLGVRSECSAADAGGAIGGVSFSSSSSGGSHSAVCCSTDRCTLAVSSGSAVSVSVTS